MYSYYELYSTVMISGYIPGTEATCVDTSLSDWEWLPGELISDVHWNYFANMHPLCWLHALLITGSSHDTFRGVRLHVICDTPRVSQVFCPDTPNGRGVVKPGMMEMEMEIERTLIALTHTSMCTEWGRESNHAHLFLAYRTVCFSCHSNDLHA